MRCTQKCAEICMKCMIERRTMPCFTRCMRSKCAMNTFSDDSFAQSESLGRYFWYRMSTYRFISALLKLCAFGEDTIICIRRHALEKKNNWEASANFYLLFVGTTTVSLLCALHNVFTTHFNVKFVYNLWNLHFVPLNFRGENECEREIVWVSEREWKWRAPQWKHSRVKKAPNLRHYWKLWTTVF